MINLHKEASIHICEDEYQAAEIRHYNQPERGGFCVCVFFFPTASKCKTVKEQSCYY